MKRPRIGDIIRITTERGAVLAHYSHRHAAFGALLRVLGPVGPGESLNEGELARRADRPPRFLTFFPLGAAVSRGIAEVVGHAPLPSGAEAFPLFRAGARGPGATKVGDNWWLWDGVREWRVGALASDQRQLPIREIVNDTLLVERVLAGWTPEQVE